MISEIERLLINCLTSQELRLRKEACIIIVSLLRTKNQQGTMIAWIEKHYKENPSEKEVILAAERIARVIT